MNDEEPMAARPFSVGRVVALAVIGVLAFGLVYLAFAPSDKSVSVPAGAQDGDVSLESCSYDTEQGSYDADCGTLVVAENRADPESRLIALPLTRIRAQSDSPSAPIFRLEGGPGISNMSFSKASRLADNHDVVLVGYRGVEGSSVLDCPEVESALKGSEDMLGDETLREYSEAFTACAERLQQGGVDLDGYSLVQRVDDLEAARVGLGYDRINLLSESVGTRTAMIYSWRYPESLDRSVMIGANPPGRYMWDPKITDEQIEYYAELCSKDESCRGRTDDLAEAMRSTAADMPDRWLFLPIKEGNVKVGSFFGLMETTEEVAPLAAPITLRSWLSADEGDASGFWFISFLADLAFPEAFVWGEMAATGMIDAPVVREYYAAGGDPGSILGNPGTDFIWGGGRLADAWPEPPVEDEYRQVRTSDAETLVIGGTIDFSTPAKNATDELMPSLPNGHQIVLTDFGHSTDFWDYQPEASTQLLTTFYDTGEVDDSLYTTQQVDFDTGPTHTALGKGFAGAMVGIALIAILSLLLMPLRIRRRGSFGHKTSVVLRAVYPLILGLGGWFTATLLVIIIWPHLALDNVFVAVLSTGLPIGLGIYWAWVHRDWAASVKTRGLSLALAGAIVGAWAGFSSTSGLFSLITAIVGAAIGANLALIALDIKWDRAKRDRTAPHEAASAQPHRPHAAQD